MCTSLTLFGKVENFRYTKQQLSKKTMREHLSCQNNGRHTNLVKNSITLRKSFQAIYELCRRLLKKRRCLVAAETVTISWDFRNISSLKRMSQRPFGFGNRWMDTYSCERAAPRTPGPGEKRYHHPVIPIQSAAVPHYAQ
ncbi:hypothetical protein X801_01641, partial [Opisthorchis viverrini]